HRCIFLFSPPFLCPRVFSFFPYTTLFRSVLVLVHGLEGSSDSNYMRGIAEKAFHRGFHVVRLNQRNCGGTEALTPTLYNSGMSGDRKSTRLNSSHVAISYAVFCLKKKKF